MIRVSNFYRAKKNRDPSSKSLYQGVQHLTDRDDEKKKTITIQHSLVQKIKEMPQFIHQRTQVEDGHEYPAVQVSSHSVKRLYFG